MNDNCLQSDLNWLKLCSRLHVLLSLLVLVSCNKLVAFCFDNWKWLRVHVLHSLEFICLMPWLWTLVWAGTVFFMLSFSWFNMHVCCKIGYWISCSRTGFFMVLNCMSLCLCIWKMERLAEFLWLDECKLQLLWVLAEIIELCDSLVNKYTVLWNVLQLILWFDVLVD